MIFRLSLIALVLSAVAAVFAQAAEEVKTPILFEVNRVLVSSENGAIRIESEDGLQNAEFKCEKDGKSFFNYAGEVVTNGKTGVMMSNFVFRYNSDCLTLVKQLNSKPKDKVVAFEIDRETRFIGAARYATATRPAVTSPGTSVSTDPDEPEEKTPEPIPAGEIVKAPGIEIQLMEKTKPESTESPNSDDESEVEGNQE